MSKNKKWVVIEENCFEVEAKTKEEAMEIVKNVGLIPYNTNYIAAEKAGK